jgi:hypothetical protein
MRLWPEGKEEFCREHARRLEDLHRDIGLLRMVASRRLPKEDLDFLDRLEDLRDRTGRLQRALEVYGSEEGRVWRSFRSKAEGRWTELRREFRDAVDWYRARYPRGPKTASPAAEAGVELLQPSQPAESEIGSS